MITMLLYVLFSWAAFDFPVHTLRLLHTLALASQHTLRIPFASILSGISTSSPFSVSLPFSVLRNTWPKTPVVRVTQVLSTKTVHIKRPNDTLMYLTMPRLLQLCLRFGRYLRPFGPDTTFIFTYLIILNILRVFNNEQSHSKRLQQYLSNKTWR